MSYSYTDEELLVVGDLEQVEKNSEIARIILTTVGSVIGLLPSEKPMPKDNFFDIGGNSINAVLAIAKLNDIGHRISVEQFIAADTIQDVVKIVLSNGQDLHHVNPATHDSFFKLRPLRLEDKDQARQD